MADGRFFQGFTTWAMEYGLFISIKELVRCRLCCRLQGVCLAV